VLDGVEQIEFEVLIKGTPPKCEDKYVIFMQIYDPMGKELADHNERNSKGEKTATDEWVLNKVTIKKSDLLGTNAAVIRVFEMGKDVEYWAGHFGTKFADEKVTLKFSKSGSTDSDTNHIKHILGTRPLPSILPLCTNFSKSMGSKYFSWGKLLKSEIKYNNLNDCDWNCSYNNYVLSPSDFKKDAFKILLKDGITPSESVNCYPTSDVAYNGTHWLNVMGQIEAKQTSLVKLYKLDFNEIESFGQVKLRVVYYQGKQSKDVEVQLVIRDKEDKLHKVFLPRGSEESKGDQIQWSKYEDDLSKGKNLTFFHCFKSNITQYYLCLLN
jgi:hypothetical protein